MAQTHIRLDLSGRDDATAILIPIAGSVFMLSMTHQTIVITPSGQRYQVDDSLPDIQDALEAVRLGAEI